MKMEMDTGKCFEIDGIDDDEISCVEWKQVCRNAYLKNNSQENEIDNYVDAIFEYLFESNTHIDDDVTCSEIEMLFANHPLKENVNELKAYYLMQKSFSAKSIGELNEIVTFLSSIRNLFVNNSSIACDLACVLSNLIALQEYADAVRTLESLKSLKAAFRKEEEIRDAYCEARDVIKNKKALIEYREAICTKEKEYTEKKTEETAVELAESLSELSSMVITQIEAQRVADEILELANDFPLNQNLKMCYLNSLQELLGFQNYEAAAITLEIMQNSIGTDTENEEYAEIMAKSLAKITLHNDKDINGHVIRLAEYHSDYPENATIAEAYAIGLYAAADVMTNKTERIKTIELIHSLAEKYKTEGIEDCYKDAMTCLEWDEDIERMLSEE